MTAPARVPVLDRTEGLRRTGGDEKLRRELAQVFLDDLPRLTQLIEAALASQSAPALGRAAHALKGSACQIGASALAARLGLLEAMAKNDDLRDAQLHRSLLAKEIQMLLLALTEEQIKPTAQDAIGGAHDENSGRR